MKVAKLFGSGRPVFSFEFFLPKTPEGMKAFLDSLRGFKALGPAFVTLTYGAGGSARSQTLEMAGRMHNEFGLETVAHLTCVAHDRAEIRSILQRLKDLGIENIMALRGDPPKDGPVLPVEKRELKHAADLVREIKAFGGFCMGVAGYPEKHPEAPTMEEDLRRLKEKCEAGADFITTQLFFDNAYYFRFVEQVRAMGITLPVLPGLMPVTNYGQLVKFSAMCGTKIPSALAESLEPVQDDPEAVVARGIDWTFRQARELLDGGAPGIHFYTLNKTRSTETILARLLDKRPAQA